MLAGKRILLGVTGGVAAYKAVYLLREFQKAGAEVRVIMTPSATRFVGVETFASLSRNEVAVEVFNDGQPGDSWTKHIQWGEWADLFLIAPCTANTLAKITHGQAGNMLTTTILTARCPILLCPTMDGEMYESAAVQSNLKRAAEMGFYIMEPDSGYLASGLEAKGRLPEPEQILKQADKIITEHAIQGPLTGKTVLVTAGPTREFIDPVRFISNPSTGKMGIAMAEAAYMLGGNVKLLCGPITAPVPDRLSYQSFVSAEDLFRLVKENQEADVIIMAAAVSDFKSAETNHHKVKKENVSLQLNLENNPDILEWLGKNKSQGQILVGFAMETDDLIKNAKSKLKRKNLDWICANSINEGGAGFGSDTNKITLLNADGSSETFTGTKQEVASGILQTIFPESRSD